MNATRDLVRGPMPVVEACPLCGRSDAQTLAVVAYSRIWTALEAEFAVRLAPAEVARHTPATETSLRECAGCGLRYFAPAVAGDARFYEELGASAGYYEKDRWEFRAVAATLTGSESVVDVGCGEGAFLGRIADRVYRAVGVDSNRDAVAELTRRGIEAHSVPFERFAAAESGSFDVVCAFQTLEHMPSVRGLLEPAVLCLRPGGRLFLSVPNPERSLKDAFEPLDYPPHHISWWDPAQLQVLAGTYGLNLRGVRFEPPDLPTVRALIGLRVASRLSGVTGPRLADLSARVYRRLITGPRRHGRAVEVGRLQAQGLYGHTTLAELALAQ